MDASTESLKAELAQAIADAEEGGTLAEINQTLAEMLDWMKSRKAETAPVVNVTNEVSPTPLQINNTVTVQRGGFTFNFKYDAQDRLTSGSLIPVPPKGA